jgi:hypothetical protein
VHALRVAPLTKFFETLSRNTPKVYASPEADIVARSLAGKVEIREHWFAEVDSYLHRQVLPRMAKARILQIVAIATGDEGRKGQFLRFLDESVQSRAHENATIDELATLSDWQLRDADVAWSATDRLAIFQRIAKWLDDAKPSLVVQNQLLNLASEVNRRSQGLDLHRRDANTFLRLVRAARELALPKHEEETVKGDGLDFLFNLAPTAFLAVASEIFLVPKESERYNHAAIQSAEIALRFLRPIGGSFVERPFPISYPRTAETLMWTAWRARNPELLALWLSDDGLRRMKSDHDLLVRVVEDGVSR